MARHCVSGQKPIPYLFDPVCIADEVYFQHEDHIAFYPGTSEQFSFENLLLVAAISRLSKTPEGIKTMENIALKYLDSCARIVEAIQDASHTNWLTALNNQHIAAAISHKIGLIDDGSYIKIMEHYRAVFDKLLVKAWVGDTIGALSTFVQGSKTKVQTPTRKEEISGLAALADTLRAEKG